MSKIGASLLKGAQEALAYMRGNKQHAKIHKIKVHKRTKRLLKELSKQ